MTNFEKLMNSMTDDEVKGFKNLWVDAYGDIAKDRIKEILKQH